MTKKETFYRDLKIKLEENTKFPSDYLYKFIVPTDKNQEKEVLAAFVGKKIATAKKASKNGKYVSISIKLRVKNADEVIQNYYSVEGIEGLISL
ncbi:DUF493 family protein [Wenyingzhuangia sp. IMCC45574]